MDEQLQTDHGASDGPLLFGRVLDGHGGARPVGWAEAQAWHPAAPGEVLWVHLNRTVPGVQEWLEGALNIPEPTAELLTSNETRPRAFREGHTLVATLRGINFNPGAEPEDMVSMQLWSDGVRVVTLRRSPLQTPRDTVVELDAGHGPADAGALVTSLTEHMIARMSRSVVDMNDHIDALEGEELHLSMLETITTIRRNCLALKRFMGPQHVALESIVRDAPHWFEDHDRREIAESIDRLHRYLEDIDTSKESAVVLQDELRARSLARSERTSSIFAAIAVIFLPLTFVTGLLGINVGGIPGAHHADAFWIVVAICLGIFGMQLMLFWKWRWL